MRCPTCDVQLIRTERLGIPALLCPECCGEWISPKLMERLTRINPPNRREVKRVATAKATDKKPNDGALATGVNDLID